MISIRKRSLAFLLLAVLLPAGCQKAGQLAGPTTVSPSSSSSVVSSSSPSAEPASPVNSTAPNVKPQPVTQSPAGGPSAQANGIQGKVMAVRLASAASGWIGGKGWIARTDDEGKHWQTQYTGDATITQIFALNDKQAWAVTDKRNLLSTTDGGKNWGSAGTVPNNGFLHFVSVNEAFAANQTTTDGGKSWHPLPIPNDIVGDAYFHDKSNGWAVIQNNGTGMIQRTTDGGRTWKTVMGLKLADSQKLNGALIRSAGTDDAWVEWIGDSGMTQTSYSLFHTTNGGDKWETVIANDTAGGGPAPGFPSDYHGGPRNQGARPGPLYVVDRKTAFMGGSCPACDLPNTIGWTKDGGAAWVNGTAAFPGYGDALLAFADADHGWWICTDNADPSVMYTTSDGGSHWSKAYTFPKPKPAS